MIECLKNLLIFLKKNKDIEIPKFTKEKTITYLETAITILENILKNSHSLAINTEKYVREKKGSAKNG